MARKNDWVSTLIIIISIAAILACGAYLLYNYIYLPRKLDSQNAGYAALYAPATSSTPVFSPAPPVSSATAPVHTPAPSPMITPTSEPTPTPAPSSKPTTVPIITPSLTAAPTPAYEIGVIEDEPSELIDIALGTPGPDTVIISAPTPPPVQESFADLLALNPETAGFLRFNDIALPVVQRVNDNQYYLEHDFEGNESSAGCLFLDGANRLYPADACLYVYGHNMKNGAMFGKLSDYTRFGVLKNDPIIRFDTIYRDGEYAPFACFAVSADPADGNYFKLRAFVFDEQSFDAYVAELKSRSQISIPLNVKYGDELLVLVTCNYSIDDGRFIIACRRLREGETENTIRAIIGQAQ